MKKLVLGIMLIVCTAMVFGQSVLKHNFKLNVDGNLKKAINMQKSAKGIGADNYDFEEWNSNLAMAGLGEMPNGWLMITGNPPAQKSTTAQSGNYAIHVESNVVTIPGLQIDNELIGGQAFIGSLAGSTLAQGEPYAENLVSVSGYIRGELFANDSAIIIIETTNKAADAPVRAGAAIFGASHLTTDYAEFTIDLEIPEGAVQIPDNIDIIITSTGVGLFQGFDIGTLTAGSWIEVDNLTFTTEEFTTPIAYASPLAWNAGNIIIGGGDINSPTFTLTNLGVGTLTVSDVTSLTSPWSTTFEASEISLENEESYTFTFNYNPTQTGLTNETFVITTNGGEITITLSGNCIEAGATMDGGFETNVGDFDLEFMGWTQHDIDGSATYGIESYTYTNAYYTGSFMAFNPSATTPQLSIEPHTGNRFGACFAAVDNPNNDWLITPKSGEINDGAIFRMYVKTHIPDYGLERYTVNISTTGTNVADFTKISQGEYIQAPADDWTLVEYNLSNYIGQEIYVGIQCISDDSFIFMVDDIEIDNPVEVNENAITNIKIYPNPVNDVVYIANAENANIVIVNMLGEVVANVNNASSNQNIDISKLANGTYFVKVDGEVFKINVVK